MSKYSFEDSLRDKTTLPLHFEPKMVKYHVDREEINRAFAELTDNLDEDSKRLITKKASRRSIFIHADERVREITENIVEHYTEKVEPNGFKAMIVCYDQDACDQYKKELDKNFPPESSEVIMTVAPNEDRENIKIYRKTRQEEDEIKERFVDPIDPLKFLIVTARLLKGFDAPILQVMYLDKLMKNHTLLQAVTRTNRPYPMKSFGWIVDYIGVFDEVANSLVFDEEEMKHVITNLDELLIQLPIAVEICLDYFKGVDRSISGWEGLIAAQECLPTNERKDNYAADYSVLSRLWEAISPDSCLDEYHETYRWLSQVYESLKPPSGRGKLLWQALGAKTIEIINEHIHIETIRDDLDTLVLDNQAIQNIIDNPDLETTKIIEIKIARRLRKHSKNPIFIKLGQKLEDLKEAYEKGFINSLELLKKLLSLAEEVIKAEKKVEPADEQKKAKAALTELFEEMKTEETPIIVERIVNDIDEVVNIVRFDGWQQTNAGTREVKLHLRKTLKKYQLHRNNELFDKAYAYIEQYY